MFVHRSTSPRPRFVSGWPGAALLAVVLAGAMLSGCRSAATVVGGLPQRHVIRREGFVVRSNFALSRDHPLVEELAHTRETVARTLQLPSQQQPVDVYIFADEVEYKQYMGRAYPGLPVRRAYFIGTPRELSIFTFRSDLLAEDLRHEFTHGILHASLGDVPLWIDEGLAEYFEVHGPVGTPNADYVRRLNDATANGWRPNVARLERLEAVHHMQRLDYQEAWAWTHYMLHGSQPLRGVLLEYLADVRLGDRSRPLSARIQAAQADADAQMLNHLAGLSAGVTWAAGTSPR